MHFASQQHAESKGLDLSPAILFYFLASSQIRPALIIIFTFPLVNLLITFVSILIKKKNKNNTWWKCIKCFPCDYNKIGKIKQKITLLKSSLITLAWKLFSFYLFFFSGRPRRRNVASSVAKLKITKVLLSLLLLHFLNFKFI